MLKAQSAFDVGWTKGRIGAEHPVRRGDILRGSRPQPYKGQVWDPPSELPLGRT